MRGLRGVDPRVDQPVQRHRERAGADHRDRDPEQVVRRRDAVDREERADVGERQREDRVLDLDQAREEPRRADGVQAVSLRCGRGRWRSA